MRNLIAIPIIVLSVQLQSSIVSRVPLLSGTADLPLVILAAWALQDGVETSWHWALAAGLLIGFISAIPFFVPVVGYIFVAFLAQLLQRRIWQTPLLAMFVVCLIGTIFMHVFSLATLRLFGVPLPIAESLGLFVLPGALLNLLLAIPVYAIMRDVARWVHPLAELE
jgi:rod shape-determining protein MreD